MMLTFDQWLASRARFAETEIAASHPCRDLDVDFVALHVFCDGAWIIERHNGDFWTIAGHDEFNGAEFDEAARWLWSHHSSWECGDGMVADRPVTTPYRNWVIIEDADARAGTLTDVFVKGFSVSADCTPDEAALMLFHHMAAVPVA